MAENGGIKIQKADWMEMKPVVRDAAMFDCLQRLLKNSKRQWIAIGVLAVIVVIENPDWAKFIIGKAMAAF